MVRVVNDKTETKTRSVDLLTQTFQINIQGRIQGVGFRPFVYGLAKAMGVCGTINNTEKGVQIHLNATDLSQAEGFLHQIKEQLPEVAQIYSTSIEVVNLTNFSDFTIIPSTEGAPINSPLTPDFALCDACKDDLNDPSNRRYNYPFTTCVSCGPRYSITQTFPFERENTAMTSFPMCSECLEEYSDPANRRFHSQTNTCPSCGIQLKLTTADNIPYQLTDRDTIAQTAALILEGKIVAVKSTNGYLLCCDANNESTIKTLRSRKRRPTKPFAVLYPELTKVTQDFTISKQERQALTSIEAPIVILKNKNTTSIQTSIIAPGLHQTGVMMPSSALMYLLVKAVGKPMIVTSGNMHKSAIIATEEEALEKLGSVADYFLHNNLKIRFPQDDSVLLFADHHRILLRRSRGFAPNVPAFDFRSHQRILTMGAQLKSSFVLQPNAHLYASQYFGNLEHIDVLTRYQETLLKFITFFDNTPEIVLVDKHPSYQSSLLGHEFALQWQARLETVQHHKAHFCSVMGEHALYTLDEPILGVIWDGNGWGDDQQIWGGEFFLFQNQTIERVAHFEYFPWIASEKMAQEPRISLLSLSGATASVLKTKFSTTELSIYRQLYSKASLVTSSVGRLFDAVASALGLMDISTYEAEAAMLLEQKANEFDQNDPIDLMKGMPHRLCSQTLIQQLLTLKDAGYSVEKLAYSFYCTLVDTIIDRAHIHQTKIIACSGGVFQSALLIRLLQERTEALGLRLKLNQSFSPNDENIAFGQFIYHQLKKETLCV